MAKKRYWRPIPFFSLSVYILVLIANFTNQTYGLLRASTNSSTFIFNRSNSPQCFQSSDRCISLGQTQCLDLTLPYRSTLPGGIWNLSVHNPSVPWTDTISAHVGIGNSLSSPDEADVLAYVNLWSGLRSVPRCWAAFQTLMCTSLMPRCENSRVHTPNLDLCRTVRTQCKVIVAYMAHRSIQTLPPWLNCNESQEFRPRCRNEYQDLRVNASAARCASPLVQSDHKSTWFPNFDGCALQCTAYETPSTDRLRFVLAFGTLIAFFCNLFALAGLIIGWRNLRRPSHFLAHINACHVLHSLGWAIQLLSGRFNLACRPDRSARSDELASGSACVLSLILLYFSATAIVCWYIALAYSWGIGFGRWVGVRQYLRQHTRHLYLITYGVSFALTLSVLVFAHIDGSWNLGVCFISFQTGISRYSLVAIPLVISLTAILFLMSRNLHILYSTKSSERRPEKVQLINQMIRKLGICVSSILFIFFSFFAITYLKRRDQQLWHQHFNDKLLCSLNLTQALLPGQSEESDCIVRDPPSFLIDYWIVFILFGSGILSSSWTWNRATMETWRRWLLLRLLDDSQILRKPTVTLKNEVIAKTYKNREQPAGQEYSPSLQSMHEDPVRMDLGSATPERLSASFVNQLPSLLSRRGAVFKDTFKDSHLLHTYPLHVQRLLANGLGENELKPTGNIIITPNGLPNSSEFHASIGAWSDVSQNLHASIDSLATHSFDSNATKTNSNVGTLQQKRKTKRERDAELMHKNFKARHARLLATMSRRKGSDTSSIVSMLAVNGKQVKSVATCKATSTGDLQKSETTVQCTVQELQATTALELTNNTINQTTSAQYQSNVNHHMPQMYSGFPMMNQIPPMINNQMLPNMSAVVNRPLRRRPQLPEQGEATYAFMHGMSEQDNRANLINPFDIKRRPDSVAKLTNSNSISLQNSQKPPSGSMASAFHCDGSNLQIQSSFMSGHFMPLPLPNQMLSNPQMPGQMPYPNVPMMSNFASYPMQSNPSFPPITHPHAGGHLTSGMQFSPYVNPIQPTIQPQQPQAALSPQMYLPPNYTGFNPATTGLMAARAAQRTYKTLEDLHQDMREREAIVRICQGVDSASEANESIFPIALSDTDGFMTDASGTKTRLSRASNSAQRIVQARIQKVHDDQQAMLDNKYDRLIEQNNSINQTNDLGDQSIVTHASLPSDDTIKKKKKTTKKFSKKRTSK